MDGKINEVRSANDIVDVISSYIPLEKKGKKVASETLELYDFLKAF